MCQAGPDRARDTVCELCYGSGCKSGYRAASRMGYVISLQCLMDITAGCKDFYFQEGHQWGLSCSLSCRGDCKHCYRGHQEVCVEVHGQVTSEIKQLPYNVLK